MQDGLRDGIKRGYCELGCQIEAIKDIKIVEIRKINVKSESINRTHAKQEFLVFSPHAD